MSTTFMDFSLINSVISAKKDRAIAEINQETQLGVANINSFTAQLNSQRQNETNAYIAQLKADTENYATDVNAFTKMADISQRDTANLRDNLFKWYTARMSNSYGLAQAIISADATKYSGDKRYQGSVAGADATKYSADKHAETQNYATETKAQTDANVLTQKKTEFNWNKWVNLGKDIVDKTLDIAGFVIGGPLAGALRQLKVNKIWSVDEKKMLDQGL